MHRTNQESDSMTRFHPQTATQELAEAVVKRAYLRSIYQESNSLYHDDADQDAIADAIDIVNTMIYQKQNGHLYFEAMTEYTEGKPV